MSRFINSLNGSVEIGGQLAACALLGLPSNVYSSGTALCFIGPAVAAVQQRISGGEVVEESSGDDSSLHCDFFDERRVEELLVEDFDEIAVDHLDDDEFDLLEIENGTVQVVDVNEIVDGDADNDEEVAVRNFVDQHTTYTHRHSVFDNFTFYEFVGMVAVKKGSANFNDEGTAERGRGRPQNTTWPLNAPHPQASTHCLALKSKQDVPLLAGRGPPRHPGPRRPDPAWKKRAAAWAAYVITLHVPWLPGIGVPPIALTYAALVRHLRTLAVSSDYVDRARLFWIRCLAQVTRWLPHGNSQSHLFCRG